MTPLSPPQNFWQRHRNLLTGLLLAILAWAIYFPSTQYGFVYFDDVRILKDHPELYGQPKLAGDLHAIFETGFPREEPLLLRDVTWAVDGRIFGFGNGFGYHLGNVLFHGIVVALMFGFLLGTTRRYGFALAVSIAFLVVAVHTEPVDWIMGRKDILSALFMLLALCAQTRRLAAAGRPARFGWYGLTLLFFVCGLFSKISVLTFPLVLFLHAIFLPYLNGERPPNAALTWGRDMAGEILLFLPALVLSGLVYHWYRRILSEMGIFDRGYTAHGLGHLWNLLMVDPLAFWTYLQQIAFPWHLKVLYSWPHLKPVYPLWQILVSLGTVIAIAATGVGLFFRRKDLFFYFSVFFVLMVPYLNLIYIGIWVAERYVYFSVFCVLALIISITAPWLRKPSPVMRISLLLAGAVFLIANIGQTLLYQPCWRNGETLWEYHLTLPNPTTSDYSNLAAYFYAQATDRRATPEAALWMDKMSVVVDTGLQQFWPDHLQPPPADTYFLFFLKSIVQQVEGKPDAALASLLTADRLHPHFDSTELNLARLYHQLAEATTDPKLRTSYAHNAREHFEQYIKLAFRGQPEPAAVQKELAELVAADSKTNPSPGKAANNTNR